jgi:hypothetical protein
VRARPGREMLPRVLMVLPRMAERLRDGLYSELGFIGEEIGELSLRQQLRRARPYRGPRLRVEGVIALLDAIGWDNDQLVSRVRVDLGGHRALALAVLQRQLKVELDVLGDARMAQRQAVKQRVSELRDFIARIKQMPLDPQAGGNR